MQGAYVAWLCCVWGSLPTALLAGVAFVVVACVLFASDRIDEATYACVIAIGAALLVYHAAVNTRGGTARILSGALPCTGWLGTSRAPRTLKELDEAIVELRDNNCAEHLLKTFKCPDVVGSGWGYFTMRRGARGKRLFMHRMNTQLCLRGQCEVDEFVRFGSGATILHCVEAFRRMEKAFYSHPTISHISIGSWFACSCHGNAGPDGQPSSHCVADRGIEVWDMTHPGRPKDSARHLSYREARRLFDNDNNAKTHLVVSVTFDVSKLAEEDTRVQKKLHVIKKQCEKDARDWLKEPSMLRVLFMGTARDVALGLNWVKVDINTIKATRPLFFWLPCFRVKHVDEHDCGFSRIARATQMDTFSAIVGIYERSGDSWKGVSSLSDANLWTPLNINPLAPLAVALYGLLNYEIIFRVPGAQGMNVKLLTDLVTALIEMHEEQSKTPLSLGRTELRYGGTMEDTTRVVFLDCAMPPRLLQNPFSVIKQVFPDLEAVALHNGKYRGEDVQNTAKHAGLKLVTPHEVYYPTGKLGEVRSHNHVRFSL